MGILNKAFFHIGFHIASNPCTSCFFALMMTLVFCGGFLNFSLTVPNTHPLNFDRMIPWICGFLLLPEPTSSRISSTSTSVPSIALTPSS